MENEILEKVQVFLESNGFRSLSKTFSAFLEERKTEEQLIEAIEKWTDTKDKSRILSFGCCHNVELMVKFYITTARKFYHQETGQPCIIINETAEDAAYKDNPYKNKILFYKEESRRDYDFERLSINIR